MKRSDVPKFVRSAMFYSPVFLGIVPLFILTPLFRPLRVTEEGSTICMIDSLNDWAPCITEHLGYAASFAAVMLLAALWGIPQAKILIRLLAAPTRDDQRRIVKTAALKPPYLWILLAKLLTVDRKMRLIFLSFALLSALGFVLGMIFPGIEEVGLAFVFLLLPVFAATVVFAPFYLLLFWYPFLPR